MDSLATHVPRRLAAVAALAPARELASVALYLALAWVSFVHPMRGLNITPWNPQAAVVVALLLWRPRSWWAAWLAVAVGEALVPVQRLPWGALLASTAMLTAGYALTARGLARWVRPGTTIVTRRELGLFIAVAGAGALMGTTLRVFAMAAFGEVPLDRVPVAIHRGAIGDGVGLLVTLPVLLLLGARERRAGVLAMLRTLEWWLIVAVTVVGIFAVFAQPTEDQFKFFYLLFLPVVWAAVRFGVTGAACASALVQVTLMMAVYTAPYLPVTVFELQLLVAVLAATGLLLGTTVDEREEASRTLRASLRLAAAGDMAAALAHELNQPLTAISTYAHASQVLAERLGPDVAAPLVDVTAKLADEATRAGEVVKRLRNFFRDRATQLQPTPVRELLDEAVRSQVARALALQVRLGWSCHPEDATAWVDPVQIGVVLRNLVANALDAASEDARRGGPPGAVTIDAHRDGTDMVVAVTDSAPGLRGEDTAAVFERRSSEKPGGMGVGLAISRSIVEAHGGTLWAEAGPGGRFLFTLPLGSPPAHD
jgi:signal transduction histidine kinase